MQYKTLSVVGTKNSKVDKIIFTGSHGEWESGGTYCTCYTVGDFLVLQNFKFEPYFICKTWDELSDYLKATTGVELTLKQKK